MERRLKERLTGAFVLVLIGVVAIPALLDGPEDPMTVNRGLALPASGPAGETSTRTITLGNEPAPAAPAARPVVPALVDPPPRDGGRADDAGVVAAAPTPAPAAAPPRPAASPAASQAPQAGWAVQVGSFSQEGNAQRFSELLRNDGYRAFVVRNVVDGVVRFRVRVGPEPAKERAEELAARLRADGHPTRVVEHP